MITILKNITKFVTEPKNTRMILLGIIIVFLLLFLNQCNRTAHFKSQVEIEKGETKRLINNYEAALDTIKQGKVDENTWRAEKAGFEITLEELEDKYAKLLGDFKLEKNKPPKVIIKTEYIIEETINNVPIYIDVDSLGNTTMTFNDSTYHDSLMVNYRFLSGNIPYKIILDQSDSTYKAIPDLGTFNLTLGMNLNLGLFQDEKTRKINIKADTDYPGVKFTEIEGASIMDEPANKKILRQLRKPWSIGLNLGYGAIVDVKSGKIATGPYFGVGLSYSPKFLQWGK